MNSRDLGTGFWIVGLISIMIGIGLKVNVQKDELK